MMLKNLRRKGSVFVQYVIVFPIFITTLWLILQTMVFMYANNQVDRAADETAKYLAEQMRGYEGTFNDYGDETTRTRLADAAFDKAKNQLSGNGFILIDKNEDGANKAKTEFLPGEYSEAGCKSKLESSDQNVFCIISKKVEGGSSRSHYEVTVKMQIPFKIIGNFIPYAQGRILLNGSGTSTLEVSGRYQYY